MSDGNDPTTKWYTKKKNSCLSPDELRDKVLHLRSEQKRVYAWLCDIENELQDAEDILAKLDFMNKRLR